ncbi:MAG: NAD(P)/FAD-dependent oxidoreductase [Fimbriimonadales bacterium]
MEFTKPIIIVGVGAAGVGMGICLRKMGLDATHFTIYERERIGASFHRWPRPMRFISPSFTGNFFGVPDLNALSPDTSPAFTLQTEHPSGEQDGRYLEILAEHYDLPIRCGIEVQSVRRKGRRWVLQTNAGTHTCKALIWAGGEFQYPNTAPFPGAEHAIHIAHLNDYTPLKGQRVVIIGGYESGFDVASWVLAHGGEAVVIDGRAPWEIRTSDSSYSLSPFTRDRIAPYLGSKRLRLIASYVETVERIQGTYRILTQEGSVFTTKQSPILCTGFRGSVRAHLEPYFEWEEGYPVLTDRDESTLYRNLFLVGPTVRHGSALFCFIYKFRQRFPVVASTLARRFRIGDPRALYEYAAGNMWLEDLSCCDNDCAC